MILSAAAQREDRNVLPLPGSLRGGAAAKVVGALLKRGLIAETATDSQTKADAALNRIWRNDEDGRRHPPAHHGRGPRRHRHRAGRRRQRAHGRRRSAERGGPAGRSRRGRPAPKARTPRTGTKQAKLIEMLRAEGGATIDEIVAATAGKPHTVRGAMAGALKKKLGLTITSEKVEGRGRVYSLPRD